MVQFWRLALLIACLVVSGVLMGRPAYSASGERLSSPYWTPPGARNQYPGYAEFEKRRKNSPDWRYQTNRPRGNTRGSRGIAYKDYRSISEMAGKREDRRPQRLVED